LFEALGPYGVYHGVLFLTILLFLVASTSWCIYRNSPLMLRELRSLVAFAYDQGLSWRYAGLVGIDRPAGDQLRFLGVNMFLSGLHSYGKL